MKKGLEEGGRYQENYGTSSKGWKRVINIKTENEKRRWKSGDS